MLIADQSFSKPVIDNKMFFLSGLVKEIHFDFLTFKRCQ